LTVGRGRVLDRLVSDSALAPAIWPLEIANALRTAERRGRLQPADIPRVRELLVSLPVTIEVVDLRNALGEVLDLARRLDLTAYDTTYLELAARRGLALATVDDRLRAACVQSGVDLVA
jgi:predicted nucleic acid-binding protein